MPPTPNPLAPANPHKVHTGWQRVVLATWNSWAGLQAAWRHESAFRQESVLFALLLPLGLWLGQSWLERAVLIGVAALVLIVELLNSAVESAIDRISLDHHEFSKRAKDLGSAAVLVSLLLCAAVWMAAIWARWMP